MQPTHRQFRLSIVKVLIVLSNLPLQACSTTTPPHRTSSSLESELDSIHFVGRVEREGGVVRYAWSGAGFVARFEGTGVAVQLTDSQNEHQVVLDGRSQATLVTRAGMNRYVLARGLQHGVHQLEVYRRTEALFGVTQFHRLEVNDGSLLPPTRRPSRRIELVGDSITCGYGNLGTSPECKFSPQTENHYLSYGALLARMFDAELSTIAWSGRGVVKNYAGEPGDKMGELYRRVLPGSRASGNVRDKNHDLVIVNLGTNDYSTDPDPDEELFATEYVHLLQKIRANNPSAFILCTVGPMLTGNDLTKARRAIALAVERLAADGDRRMLAYELSSSNVQPGCDWHPGLLAHQKMAEELASIIRLRLAW